MKLPAFNALNLRRRIHLLWLLRWLAFPVLPVACFFVLRASWKEFLVTLAFLAMAAALQAWEQSARRQFIREAQFPRHLGSALRARHPQLSAGDADLVLRGLRQFFLAYLRSGRRFVAMPSQVVDDAWHAFILHTRGYESWCSAAFGMLLHHTPAEVLGRDPKRNDGLRRAWYWACKEESIDPRKPSRLPLLFALDRKYVIAGGFTYVPDCSDIDRQSGSAAYCGSSFGDGGDAGGGDGGSAGDADGFGGSESSGADGSGDGGGDSSGCGGGCGGD